MNPEYELARTERLRHVVIGTELEADYAVLLVVFWRSA